MDVTLLGTGSALPTGDRYQTGIAVDSPANPPLLFDCGAGAIHRLVQAGYEVTDVSAVFLTHHHLDHVADLPSLLKARVLLDEPQMTVAGPPGTGEYLGSLLSVDRLSDRASLTIREHEPGADVSLCGYELATCETDHSAPGFALRIGDAFAYSGDTEASDRVAALADGSTVLLHDCAYRDEGRTNHATPGSLRETLAGIDVDHIYLTHLYPEAAASAEEIRATVAGGVDAAVHVASDLETVSIPE